MLKVILFIICVHELCSTPLVNEQQPTVVENHVNSVEQDNNHALHHEFEKEKIQIFYNEIVESLKSIYIALNNFSHPSSFEKRIDGEVCVKKSTYFDKVLVTYLRDRIIHEETLHCTTLMKDLEVKPTASVDENPTAKTDSQQNKDTTTSQSPTPSLSSTTVLKASVHPSVSATVSATPSQQPATSSQSTEPAATITPSLVGREINLRRKRRAVQDAPKEPRTMNADEKEVLKKLKLDRIPAAKAWREHCAERGEKTSVNTRNMCPTCQYIISLPPNYYPQFHRHLTCGSKDDNSCFSSQGICSKTIRTTNILILHPSSPLVVDELELELTTCCSCEIVAGNLFEAFV